MGWRVVIIEVGVYGVLVLVALLIIGDHLVTIEEAFEEQVTACAIPVTWNADAGCSQTSPEAAASS